MVSGQVGARRFHPRIPELINRLIIATLSPLILEAHSTGLSLYRIRTYFYYAVSLTTLEHFYDSC